MKLYLPSSLLRPPSGFKKPDVKDLLADMQRLGEDIAAEFMDTIIENIETNRYGYSLAKTTVQRKGHQIPLIDTHQLVDAIYRKGTKVSVNKSRREGSDLTNLELAMIQEYGTKDKHIPARPVWRDTFGDFRKVAEKRIEDFLETHKFRNDGRGKHKRVHKKR